MPAVNPRRECPCSYNLPIVSGRFDEKPTSARTYAWLAGGGTLLALGYSWFREFGGLGQLVFVGLVGICLLGAVGTFLVRRDESRFGLGYVRLSASPFTLPGSLAGAVGKGRGLGGIETVTIWLRCIDTILESRDSGRGTEDERVCYVVWEDSRAVALAASPPGVEAPFSFQLPAEGEFAGPVGDHLKRAWETQVIGPARALDNAISRRRPAAKLAAAAILDKRGGWHETTGSPFNLRS